MGISLGFSGSLGAFRYPGPRDGLKGFGGEVFLELAIGPVGGKGGLIFSGKNVGQSLAYATGIKFSALSLEFGYSFTLRDKNF
jgi:hypothetical protein